MASSVSRAQPSQAPQPQAAPEQPPPSAAAKISSLFAGGFKRTWEGLQGLQRIGGEIGGEQVVNVTNAEGTTTPVKKWTWIGRAKQVPIALLVPVEALSSTAAGVLGFMAFLSLVGATTFASPITIPIALAALAATAAIFCLSKLISYMRSDTKEPLTMESFKKFMDDLKTNTSMTTLGILALSFLGVSTGFAAPLAALAAVGIYYLLQKTVYKEPKPEQKSNLYDNFLIEMTRLERIRDLIEPDRWRKNPANWVTPTYS